MRPTKTLVAALGALCVNELETRERPDDVVEMNVAVIVWDAKRAELFVRSGSTSLERALRKVIDAEGR